MMRGCSMRGGLLSVLSPRVCHGTSVVGIVPRWLVRSQPAALQVVRSNTTVAMGAADTLAEKEDTDTHSEHVFSHLRKYVTVTPWNFCHDIELLQVILEKVDTRPQRRRTQRASTHRPGTDNGGSMMNARSADSCLLLAVGLP